MRKQRKHVVRGPQKELPGIPTRPNPLVQFRVKQHQLDKLRMKALSDGYALPEWCRAMLLKAAGVAP